MSRKNENKKGANGARFYPKDYNHSQRKRIHLLAGALYRGVRRLYRQADPAAHHGENAKGGRAEASADHSRN